MEKKYKPKFKTQKALQNANSFRYLLLQCYPTSSIHYCYEIPLTGNRCYFEYLEGYEVSWVHIKLEYKARQFRKMQC